MKKFHHSFLKIAAVCLIALPAQNAFGDFTFVNFSLGEETGYAKLKSAGMGMNFSEIGYAGNEKNTALYETRQWGAVDYNYGMGAIEVTCAQYAVFLNDTGLGSSAYMFDSSNAPYIGLYRSSDGTVGVRNGCENKSVCVVKYAEAVAFANWLSTGNAETSGMFSLPTADEWHKAAYYDPNKNGEGQGGYWKYGTGTDSITVGDGVVNTDADVFGGLQSIGQNSTSWPDADFGTENNWGILGATGGLAEWTETDQNANGTRKWVLGGDWGCTLAQLDNTRVDNKIISSTANDKIGFRLATDDLSGVAYTTLQGLDGSRTYDGAGSDAVRIVIPAGGSDGFVLTDGTILTITNSKTASSSSTGGGALFVGEGGEFSSAPLKFESDARIVFSQNSAEGNEYAKGGAVYNSGKVDLRNAGFSGNTALANYTSSSSAVEAQGGAIFNDASGTLVLKNVYFEDNTASGNSTGNNAWGRGGAIYNDKGGNITITEATFSGNSAVASTSANNKWSYGYGGAIFNASKGTISISNSEFTGNYAAASSTSYGGAILNDGDLSISKTRFSGNYITSTHENRISQGGAIANNSNAALRIEEAVFTGNYINGTNSVGGAVYNYGYGQFDITGSQFSENHVSGSIALGGAVYEFGMSWGNPCVANIEKTIFDGNYAVASGNSNVQAFGGAIYTTDATVNLTNSSFTNNHVSYTEGSTDARAQGGAIYVWGGEVNIINNDGVNRTYSGNYAKTGSETSALSGGFLYMYNSSAVSFDIAENNTVTIGSADAGTNAAHDSIASNNADAIITKKGTGTLVLNADNSGFQGTFEVTEGTLIVGKTEHAKLGGNVIVHEGATLCGIGELTGTTTILDGGSLNPGNSPGEMSFENLTLAAGSIVNIEAGDSIVINGALNFTDDGSGKKVVFNFENAEASSTPFLTFDSVAGIPEGKDINDYLEFTGLAEGQTIVVGEGGVSVVPEPSTYALFAGLATLGLVVIRRRKQKQ